MAAGGVLGLTLGVRLGAPACFLLGAPGVGQRAHPGAFFLVGQRLQDHAAARRSVVIAADRRPGWRFGARSQHLHGRAARRLGGPAGRGRRFQLPLTLDLDRDRLAAAMREALPHHAAVHVLGQLEPAGRSSQRNPWIALLLFGLGGLGVGHDRPVVFCGSVG
jgi:hypothetical protein